MSVAVTNTRGIGRRGKQKDRGWELVKITLFVNARRRFCSRSLGEINRVKLLQISVEPSVESHSEWALALRERSPAPQDAHGCHV